MIASLVVIATLGLFFIYQMVWDYPNRLAIEKIEVSTAKPLKRALTIVQISDVHIGPFFKMDRFATIIDKVNQLQADIVVITGDLLDDTRKTNDYRALTISLKRIVATSGVYAVLGNHEAHSGAVKGLLNAYQHAGVNCLVNAGECIKSGDIHLHIYGADCAMLGVRDSSFIYPQPSQAFNLLLLHQPDAITDYLHLPIDLVLSGHTHNGQVNLWGLRPILPKLGHRFVAGRYQHQTNWGTVVHYVNRGLGCTHLPLRFNSTPEISVITLQAIQSS